ncbi:3-keto-disaccharide hydrolase [Terriglobus tenax]|uniref:3-keto-disaccharide hydrolase n=1 Tax=Terriglobus tenax TaxID=1111115 RepID=UPI0021DF8F7A|nr:DUF1080 domain-containing protein [Terriglobus tenax]
MNRSLAACLLLSTTLLAQQPQATPPRGPARVLPVAVDPGDHEGFTQIFDSKTLTHWDANPNVWSVQGGAMVGEYKSAEGARNPQTFAIYRGSEPADFELKLEVRLEGDQADSGIQYHSYPAPPLTPRPGAPAFPQDTKWNLAGLQFDLSLQRNGDNIGILAEGGGRGIVGERGQIVYAQTGRTPQLLGELASTKDLSSFFKPHDWNNVHLIVRGHTVIQMINGHVTGILLDDDTTKWKASGVIGLQCAGPGSVRISFRNIWLKELQ